MPKGIGASPLPGHEVIRQFLEADNAPVGPTDILRALGLPARLKAVLRATLHDMALAGDLACLPPGRLKGVTGLPETVRAKITRLRSDGQAYAHLPDESAVSLLLVSTLPDGTLLLPGDEVIARLRPRLSLRGRREGRPLRLLSAAPRLFPATVQPDVSPAREPPASFLPSTLPTDATANDASENRTILPEGNAKEDQSAPSAQPAEVGPARRPIALVPCDRRFGQVLYADSAPLSPETVVLAELVPHQPGKPPKASIRTVLGPVDAPGMAAHLALLTHPMPTVFSPEAEAEARHLATLPIDAESLPLNTDTDTDTDTDITSSGRALPRKLSGHPVVRRDLRTIPVVTIDEATAEDFDDAIWAERTTDGFHLLIAIADVAHYVRPGSALDQDAKNRGNSVYLPGQVVPMLPLALSAGVCSLKPGEDRLCVYIDLHITADGQRVSGCFGRGLMRSAARLTYQAVQEALESSPQCQSEAPEPPASKPDTPWAALPPDLLPTLMAAAHALQQAQPPHPADRTGEEEFVVTLDASGHPTAFTPRQRLPAHDLVASFMIAANRFAAEELDRHTAPSLFRVHPAAPSPTQQGRQMARYAPRPAWHDGLRLACYTHFTSPIRRYADLVNHRALLATLMPSDRTMEGRGESATLSPSAMHALAGHLHLAERRASSATQACYNRLAALFLRPFIGQTLRACVTGTTRTGVAVTLTKTGTPSFLFSSALPDELRMNDDSPTPRTNLNPEATLQVGTVLSVVLISTNPAQGTLDLALARNAR